jgi:hypothetical protein
MAKEKEVDALIEDDEDELKDAEYVAVEEPLEQNSKSNTDDDEDEESSLKSSAEEDNASSEEDREAIRERRRLEKKERKERRDKAIGRDKIELNFLRSRNDELERRIGAVETHTQQTNLSQLDQQIQQAAYEVETSQKIIAKAVEAGNGDDVVQAMQYRDQAMAKMQQLNQHKQQQTQQVQAPRQPQVDSEVAHYAKEFMEEHSWYDPSGKDEDSAIVLAIDNKLAQEGFDPRSEEYWDELHDRIKRRLPEKFKAARKPTGGPAVGSGREHAPTSTRKEIYISPDRKAALIEAGAWDDPVLRQRYIKRYAEYDRANKS